ncbi:ATP-dependent endonuclease [Nonomuraea mangrovi]|uniref:ATP-dependent endonuclease n=1 Tax=Nonomuraea mangrovi TaxID=2316207 RepID=A0ABW4T218_9ACTN
MTVEERLQQLSQILESADHSSTSNVKYRELEQMLAEFTGLDAELIYVTYIGKAANLKVRATQSDRAKNASLLVLLIERHDQHDAMQGAARRVATQKQKPILIVQRDTDTPSWAPTFGLVPARSRAAQNTIDRLVDVFGRFEIARLSQTRTGSELVPTTTVRHVRVPFIVLTSQQRPPSDTDEALILIPDSWDDHGFRTLFTLHFRDRSQIMHEIGQVKIGSSSLSHGHPPIPERFDRLGPEFFSLGQDDTYYEKLATLQLREHVLSSLRDIALDGEIFSDAIDHEVTTKSLFRTVPRSTAEVQFRRIARGGARLTDYQFRYLKMAAESSPSAALSLSFHVKAESQPSTNMHILIGGNGVGKTTLLKSMSAALTPDTGQEDPGRFVDRDSDGEEDHPPFSNVVFISFSAFDPFLSAVASREVDDTDTLFSFEKQKVPVSYIGLGDIATDDRSPKGIDQLSDDFLNSVESCMRSTALRARWMRAIRALETDPIFRDLSVLQAVRAEAAGGDASDIATGSIDSDLSHLFRQASSGHKIVLLTMTRLVEEIRERSLVLFDEPESHLHPPLLAAFIRALSELLTDRNGVAIIATHSPVVLQEVPRYCVWKLRRSGNQSVADRPQIETFGENVGVLIHEVFGLEVTQAGYHAELRRVAAEVNTFEDAMARFEGRLGAEAQGILRILLAVKAQAGAH